MPENPSADNYTLGKGRVIFNGRDLGNVPAFTMNIALEKLEHYSSRSGLKSLDKTIITQVTPKCTFNIDEMSAENVQMSLLGSITKITQSAADIAGTVTTAQVNKNYTCINTSDTTRKLDVGVWKLPHGTVTSPPFVVGETITSSGTATGTCIKVSANYIYVNNIAVSTFASGETITGAGGASATLSADQTWTKDLAVAVSAVYFDIGTDYTINGQSGRIRIVPGGGISDDDDVDWAGSCLAKTYSIISGLAATSLNGPLVFVPDVPEGNNIELNFHSVDLTPSGDMALIGEEIMSLDFEGDILKDEENHPTSPYVDCYIDDYVT